MTIVWRLLVEHVLSQADRHRGDGRAGVRDRPAFADILPARRPDDACGGLAGAEIGFGRALVGEPAAAGHRQVVRRRTAVQAGGDRQRGQACRRTGLVDEREHLRSRRARRGARRTCRGAVADGVAGLDDADAVGVSLAAGRFARVDAEVAEALMERWRPRRGTGARHTTRPAAGPFRCGWPLAPGGRAGPEAAGLGRRWRGRLQGGHLAWYGGARAQSRGQVEASGGQYRQHEQPAQQVPETARGFPAGVPGAARIRPVARGSAGRHVNRPSWRMCRTIRGRPLLRPLISRDHQA